VVQGALKLILEPIFEADFQPGSFGYRPKRSAHDAIERVSNAIAQGKTYVIDLDLRAYFDTVSHSLVLDKVAQRVDDDAILRLLKLMLKASGKRGVAQGDVISPLLSNLLMSTLDSRHTLKGHAVNTSLYARRQHPCCRRSRQGMSAIQCSA
jgi:RNA-directed DNA polymerase